MRAQEKGTIMIQGRETKRASRELPEQSSKAASEKKKQDAARGRETRARYKIEAEEMLQKKLGRREIKLNARRKITSSGSESRSFGSHPLRKVRVDRATGCGRRSIV
jgi:hypothetical protein